MQGLYEFSGQVLRVFGILIALLIMVVETEWQYFMAFVPTLDSWFGRGVLQVGQPVQCLTGWPGRQGGSQGCLKNELPSRVDRPSHATRSANGIRMHKLQLLLQFSCNILHMRKLLLQVFEASLVYREATSIGGTDLHKSLQLYRSAACGSLLGCACIYLLGGLLCIGAIRKGGPSRGYVLSLRAALWLVGGGGAEVAGQSAHGTRSRHDMAHCDLFGRGTDRVGGRVGGHAREAREAAGVHCRVAADASWQYVRPAFAIPEQPGLAEMASSVLLCKRSSSAEAGADACKRSHAHAISVQDPFEDLQIGVLDLVFPCPCCSAARYRREEALNKVQADLDALERRRADLQRILGRAAQD